MNILLVRPHPHRDTIGLQSFMICEPLELEYLSSLAEGDGHTVEILDMILEPDAALERTVRRFAPAVVGFTAYIPHVAIVKDYARRVKHAAPSAVTVVGGVHAEVNPGDFDDPNIDHVVMANGLATFRALIAALDANLRPDPGAIPGLFDGTARRCPIEELREYPLPDRGKTARYRSRYSYIFHDDCATVKTSVGCPGRCEFCYCVEIAQHRYMERDILAVVDEIAGIEQPNIFIVDDNFLVSIPRIRAFCGLLAERKIRKNFIMFGRADFITAHPDIIRLLRDVGLRAVFVGIESFRDHELLSYDKRTTAAMNIEAVGILESLGLECYSGIMVGSDWERADFDALITFLRGFSAPLINLQPVTPIPGTRLYEARKADIAVPRSQYHLWDMAHLLLKPEKLSVRQFYWNIIRSYYLTSSGLRGHRYVIRRYGWRIYLRILRGVIHITLQYLSLALRG